MPRKRHQRHRKGSGSLWLFSEETTCGHLKVIRSISQHQGEERVRAGTARHVESPEGELLGYQFCQAPREGAVRRSSPVITRGEMELLAGTAFVRGRSNTQPLSETEKQLRVQRIAAEHGRVVPADDPVELAHAKLAAFGSGRAVAVWPKT